jgi:hypothetical protein
MKRIPLLLASGMAALILSACTPPEGEGAAATPAQPSSSNTPAADAEPVAGEVKSTLPAPVLLDAARTAEPVVVAGTCNIESADGRAFAADPLVIDDKANAKVTGWLLAKDQATPPAEPMLRIESSDKSQVWQLPLQLSIKREDLAADGATPGFEAAFDASTLPAGRYHLYLAFRSDGALAACDNGRYVDLK